MPIRLTCYQGWLYVDLLTGLAYRLGKDGYRLTGTIDAHGIWYATDSRSCIRCIELWPS